MNNPKSQQDLILVWVLGVVLNTIFLLLFWTNTISTAFVCGQIGQCIVGLAREYYFRQHDIHRNEAIINKS